MFSRLEMSLTSFSDPHSNSSSGLYLNLYFNNAVYFLTKRAFIFLSYVSFFAG